MSIEKRGTEGSEIIEKIVLHNDLSALTPAEKVKYYHSFCSSLGLNPLTQPFQILKFQGKERLYAAKDATEQLRKLHGVSITNMEVKDVSKVYIVIAKASDKSGKTDMATGAVNIANLSGEALANAIMKAETKAKRRVTLSICGLGMLDESELESMPLEDGSLKEIPVLASQEQINKIESLIKETESDKEKLFKFFKITNIEDATLEKANSIINGLETKKKIIAGKVKVEVVAEEITTESVDADEISEQMENDKKALEEAYLKEPVAPGILSIAKGMLQTIRKKGGIYNIVGGDDFMTVGDYNKIKDLFGKPKGVIK